MSASNTPKDLHTAGTYCDGNTSTEHAVEVFIAAGVLELRGADIRRAARLRELQISEPLARLPRTLYFEDGASLVLASSEALSRALAEGPARVHGLESKMRYAVAAALTVVCAVWVAYAHLIPWVADTVAMHEDIERPVGPPGVILAHWDKAGFVQPSALTQDAQQHLRETIAARLKVPSVNLQHIAFRSSAELGANALALDDGVIVMTDDLVHLLDEDEQLAVVAHELGHVHHRHHRRLWLRQLGISGALRLVTGTALGGNPVVDTTELLGQTRYSRAFETEADAYAANLLAESGIAPCHLAMGLQKLAGSVSTHKEKEWAWFSSHPVTQDRIRRVGGVCR